MIYFQIFILAVIYIGAFYAIKAIFKLDFKDILQTGTSHEFSTNSGRICFAAFVIIIVLGISNNKVAFIEHLISTGLPPSSDQTVNLINPTILFVIAVSWIIVNFIILAIFYTNRNQ
jgi:hypothetical protein